MSNAFGRTRDVREIEARSHGVHHFDAETAIRCGSIHDEILSVGSVLQ